MLIDFSARSRRVWLFVALIIVLLAVLGTDPVFWEASALAGMGGHEFSRNLLKNGGLEDWADSEHPAYWEETTGFAGYAAIENSEVLRGAHSLKLASAESPNSDELLFSQNLEGQDARDLAEKFVTIGVWFKSRDPRTTAIVRVIDYVRGAEHELQARSRELVRATDWQFVSVSKHIREGTTRISFQFGMNGVNGNTGYFDEALAYVGDIPEELQRSLECHDVEAFEGAPDGSLLLNGDFEDWDAVVGSPANWGKDGTVTQEDGVVRSGSYSAKLSAPLGGHSRLTQFVDIDSAKTPVTMGIWVKEEVARSVAVSILECDSSDCYPDTVDYGKLISGGKWQFVTVTKPQLELSDTERLRFTVEVAAGIGGAAYFDRAIAVVGTEIPKEFWYCASGEHAVYRHEIMGPPVPGYKKLLAWFVDREGADRTETWLDYQTKHTDSLVDRFAIDGYIFPVLPDWAERDELGADVDPGIRADYVVDSLWWGGAEFAYQDFDATITAVRSISLKHDLHNFMYVTTSPRYKERMKCPVKLPPIKTDRDRYTLCSERPDQGWLDLDWLYNEEHWAKLVKNNARVAAQVAHDAGLKGIFMDMEWLLEEEAEEDPFSFSYCTGLGHSREECTNQARLRGKQYIEAMRAEYPDITVILRLVKWDYWDDRGSLTGPFVEGLLDGKGMAQVVIILGHAGYRSYQELLDARELQLTQAKHYVKRARNASGEDDERVLEEWLERNLEWAYSVQIDPLYEEHRHWNIRHNLKYNYLNPQQLEHVLYNDLTASDQYVAIVSRNTGRWWFSEGKASTGCYDSDSQDCPRVTWFSPTPQAYLEAISNSRQPHDVNWLPQIDTNRYTPAHLHPEHDDSTFGDLLKEHFTEILIDDGASLSDKEWRFAKPPIVDIADASRYVSTSSSYPDYIRVGEWWENQGFHSDGVGWYRVRFALQKDGRLDGEPIDQEGTPIGDRKVFLAFAGVAGYASVYLNGASPIYHHGYGDLKQSSYDERFLIDVTDHIQTQGENVLTARVDNYRGQPGGIWNSVKLLALNPSWENLLLAQMDSEEYEAAWKFGYDDVPTFGDLWTGNYEILEFPQTWSFKFDSSGDMRDFLNHNLSTCAPEAKIEGWKEIQIGEWWENQGHPKDGVGWYRVCFYMPEHLGIRIPQISFGAVAGGVEVYLNAYKFYVYDQDAEPEPIGAYHLYDFAQRYENRRFEVEIPREVKIPGADEPQPLLNRRGWNVLIVRVINYQGHGGIWKSVKLIAGY